jgi:hypothetical protein
MTLAQERLEAEQRARYGCHVLYRPCEMNATVKSMVIKKPPKGYMGRHRQHA